MYSTHRRSFVRFSEHAARALKLAVGGKPVTHAKYFVGKYCRLTPVAYRAMAKSAAGRKRQRSDAEAAGMEACFAGIYLHKAYRKQHALSIS